MLRQKKPLKTKKQLRAKTSLKGAAKHPVGRLKKKADTLFSWVVRIRDCEEQGGTWVGSCITCDKAGMVAWRDDKGKVRYTKGWNIGHFISRGDFNLRYDEENCNLQCAHCNAWADKETMQENYRNGIALKYGVDSLKRIKSDAKHNSRASIKRTEYEQVIADCEEQLKFLTKEKEA